MTRDELVIAKIEDVIRKCAEGYYVTATDFLDSHEQALAGQVARSAKTGISGVRTFLYGGYEDAERRMLICVPSEIPMSDDEARDGLLKVLRASRRIGGRELTHRDYLGSLLGLGIERRVIGDILVRSDGADVIILADIEEFLMREYSKAGRTELSTETLPIEELCVPELRTQEIRDTVPSARLDTIVASAFKMSRAKAAEAIRAGIVSTNHVENTKPDARLDEGTIIVVKGRGKAALTEIGGESKKGRLWIRIKRYI